MLNSNSFDVIITENISRPADILFQDGAMPSVYYNNSVISFRSFAMPFHITLEEIRCPNLLEIYVGALLGNTNLKRIYFPKTQYVECGFAYDCQNLSELHMSQIESVPLAGVASGRWSMIDSLFFGHNPPVIYVPSSLYSDFISASYWSQYSSMISGIY